MCGDTSRIVWSGLCCCVEGKTMPKHKGPPGSQRTYDIHFRINPGIKAVMLEAMTRKMCKTPSEYVRKLVEEDCQRVIGSELPQKPEKSPRNDELGF